MVIVEIGNDWLKVAEAKLVSSKLSINKLSFVKLAEIKDSVADAVSRVFRDLKLNKNAVFSIIPRHLVTVRILEFPSTDAKEIKDMINLQVGKQTPYSKEEIISTYRLIGSEKEGYTKVILSIARRKIVSDRVETLQKAGIDVDKVFLSSECLYYWFDMAYLQEIRPNSVSFVLLDIDSNYSDFLVIRRGKLVFTRNILVGANHLLEEPEKWQEILVGEVKSSLQLYQNGEGDDKIAKMFLSGAAINIKGLDATLNTALDIAVENSNLLRNIQMKKEANILQEHDFKVISISAIMGAAIKNKELVLDLTPSELRIQKMMEDKRKQLTVIGILVVSIGMMASLLLLINIYNKNFYLEQIKQKTANIRGDSMEVEKMRTIVKLVEGRSDAKGCSIDILNEIYKFIPREIYILSISIDEKEHIVLRGAAFAMSDVFKFVATLEDSLYFENVKTTYTTTKKEKDREYAEFEVMCRYEKQ